MCPFLYVLLPLHITECCDHFALYLPFLVNHPFIHFLQEDASGLRRSNRTFKRPRKYFEDEMILEDEAFIFDGKAIERMFKNQPMKPPAPQIKDREKPDASANKKLPAEKLKKKIDEQEV